MKKIILIFIILTLQLIYPVSVSAGPKYTMRERFGVGSDGGGAMGKQGNGWYFNWSAYTAKIEGIDFMGTVGFRKDGTGDPVVVEETPDNPSSPICQQKKNYILNHIDVYPDNTSWTVGNEIGWDDGRTADKYADDFVKWRACLKSINPTFQVGSGGLVDTYTKLPRDWGHGCTSTPDVDGSSAYFRTYMTKLKNVYHVIPDFFVAHAYTWCRPGTTTTIIPGGYTVGVANVQDFKNLIVAHRQLLAEFGLQKKDLIMNEWADFSGNSVNYLKDTVNYLMTATDQNTGNPDDEYRLVQKWAWFLFVDTPNDFPEWKNAWLSIAGKLTPLGEAYKAMIPDPLPIGAYDADYWTAGCTVSGWTCVPSNYGASVPVNVYVDGTTPANLVVVSTTANTPHSPADPGPNNQCGGTAHDFEISNNEVRTALIAAGLNPDVPHRYRPLAINIDSSGNTRAQDANGNWLTTWLTKYMSDTATCVALPTPTSTPIPTPLPGDVNDNGQVDINDFALVVQNFNKSETNCTSGWNIADIIPNCKVDIFDFALVVQNFGKTK